MSVRSGVVVGASLLLLLGPAQQPAWSQNVAQAPKGEPAPSEEDKERRERARKKDEKGPPPASKAQPSVPDQGQPPPSRGLATDPPPAEKKSLGPTAPQPAPEGRGRPTDAPKVAPRDLPSPVPPRQPPASEKVVPALPKAEPISPQGNGPLPPSPNVPSERGVPAPAEKKSLSPPVPPSAPPATTRPADAPKGAGPALDLKKEVPTTVVPRQALPSEKAPPLSPKTEPAIPQGQGPLTPGSATDKGTPLPQQKSSTPPGSPQPVPPDAGPRPSDVPRGAGPVPDLKKEVPSPVAPGLPQPRNPTVAPKAEPAAPPGKGTQSSGSAPPAIVATPPQPQDRATRAPAATQRLDEIKTGRTERTEEGGKRTVIQEPGPGNRVIIKQDNRIIIRHDESERFRRLHRDARTERRPDGSNETFYVRSDGVRVVSVVDAHGRLVHRYRTDRQGREFSIIDNRRFVRNAGVAVGVGALGFAIALNLAPPRIRIPREQYIVNYERASDDDLYEALGAPPIESMERAYSLEEVRSTYELRQRMRRVDLDTVTFEFGSWQISDTQLPKLERIGRAIRRLLERNPNEVFLISAHTDAVGSDVDNLSLSDRRAESVAQILSEEFGIPAENIVTQGYGEQHLKIDTREPESRNRRVEVQRITPLMAER